MLIKTDADARATLDAIKSGFAQSMRRLAQRLPEYDGNLQGLSSAKAEKYRSAMIDVKGMLNEVLAFERGFKAPPRINYSDQPVTEKSIDSVVEFLDNL